MKCPFCSDNIHPNAKYCPKCGLPIKDEPTVMGAAYVPDDSTPNPWMLASAGLAVLALVFGIGWASTQMGRGANPATTSRTVAAYRTPGANTLTATPVTSGAGMATPAWGSGGANGYVARPAAPAAAPAYTPATTSPQWTYTPSVRMANAGFLSPLFWPDPLPPAVPLLEIAKAARPREATVTVAQATVPPLADEPRAQAAPILMPGASFGNAELDARMQQFPEYMRQPMAAATADADTTDSAVRSPSQVPESQRQWVWDPVHEAWARNAEYTGNRQRRTIRNTGTYR